MAKKKTTVPATQGTRSRGGKKSLNLYVEPALKDTLEAEVNKIRPKTTVTSVVELAIEEWLVKRGAWPPGVGAE